MAYVVNYGLLVMGKKESNINNKNLVIFEGTKIRRIWDGEKEKWYFSVVDIIQVLIEQEDHHKARKYWNKLKERLVKEGSELVTKLHQLKMMASDRKKYKTDTADVETILRLIQSVPSKKAEPIKLWLAKVGYERYTYKFAITVACNINYG